MKYGLIVTRPQLLPYVVPIEEPTAVQAQKAYDEGDLVAPMFIIDFEASRVLRVMPSAEGYTLTDNAEELLGYRTTAEAVENDS